MARRYTGGLTVEGGECWSWPSLANFCKNASDPERSSAAAVCSVSVLDWGAPLASAKASGLSSGDPSKTSLWSARCRVTQSLDCGRPFPHAGSEHRPLSAGRGDDAGTYDFSGRKPWTLRLRVLWRCCANRSALGHSVLCDGGMLRRRGIAIARIQHASP